MCCTIVTLCASFEFNLALSSIGVEYPRHFQCVIGRLRELFSIKRNIGVPDLTLLE